MRRVILAVTATIAGLVALLSFKSHAPSLSAAATSGTSGGSSSASSRSTNSLGDNFATSGQGGLPAGERAITGSVANTVYGPVQIQLIVKSRKIVKVAVLEQPMNTIHDIQIGEFAFPRLISETLATQTAKIDAVSGASYTSAGYIASLQSALDRGL